MRGMTIVYIYIGRGLSDRSGNPRYPRLGDTGAGVAKSMLTKFFYHSKTVVTYSHCYTVHVVELFNYYTHHCTYKKFIKFYTLKH